VALDAIINNLRQRDDYGEGRWWILLFIDVATFKVNLQHMTLFLALAAMFQLLRKL